MRSSQLSGAVMRDIVPSNVTAAPVRWLENCMVSRHPSKTRHDLTRRNSDKHAKSGQVFSASSGQALAEVALFSLLAVILAFAMLSLIPLLRARTAATSAAYACAQFLSQSPNRSKAAQNAYSIAWQTLNADWSATLGVDYQVNVSPPSGSGQPGACAVHYRVTPLFGGLGLIDPGWSTEWFVSRSETWKARW